MLLSNPFKKDIGVLEFANLERGVFKLQPKNGRGSSLTSKLIEMQCNIEFGTEPALAGAVFFLLMYGIDSLTGQEEKINWVKSPALGWIQISNDHFSEFVGLALFLAVLYLLGNQTYFSPKRYLNCIELIHEHRKLNAGEMK